MLALNKVALYGPYTLETGRVSLQMHHYPKAHRSCFTPTDLGLELGVPCGLLHVIGYTLYSTFPIS